MSSPRVRSTTPDLFAEASAREPGAATSKSALAPSIPAAKPRIVLPQNLPLAIKQLDRSEFARLYEAVIAEHESRRGKGAPVVAKPAPKRQIEAVNLTLTPG